MKRRRPRPGRTIFVPDFCTPGRKCGEQASLQNQIKRAEAVARRLAGAFEEAVEG